MDPLTMGLMSAGSSLLGSIFSSSTSASNTQAQIQASEQEQATQNAFQEQMSNTAYQRASADMTKAGLNPMMMFGSGSAASTPTGSSIQAPMPQNTSPMAGVGKAVQDGVNSAIQAKTFDKMTDEIANLQAQQAKIAADTKVSQAEVPLLNERTNTQRADTLLRQDQGALTAFQLPGARFSAKSAQDLEAMPDWLRSSLVQGSFAGKSASDIISPLTNSAKAVKNWMPSRSTSETTSSDGRSTFNERWDNM